MWSNLTLSKVNAIQCGQEKEAGLAQWSVRWTAELNYTSSRRSLGNSIFEPPQLGKQWQTTKYIIA